MLATNVKLHGTRPWHLKIISPACSYKREAPRHKAGASQNHLACVCSYKRETPRRKLIYHNSWLMDLEVTRESAAQIIGPSRSRIEKRSVQSPQEGRL